MRIEDDIKLGFSDVLIKPKRSTIKSRSDVNLNRTFTFPHSKHTWAGAPIIVANMTTTGTLEMHDAMDHWGGLTALHKYYTVDDILEHFNDELMRPEYHGPDNLIVTIGMKDADFSIKSLHELNHRISTKWICIDVANGYMERFSDLVSKVREEFPSKIIIAGNVVTSEMTEQLILAGADIVKVGIGQGAQCTTRRVTGIGIPQLSAVIECADAAHGLGGHIISDGGITCVGDIVKAFGGGADFVMAGSFFGGTTECSGDIITVGGTQYKKIYGMSSQYANDTFNGGMHTYRASEGRQSLIEYRGPVSNVLQEISGGVRSAMSYMGAISIKHIPRCCTFVRVNSQLNTSFENSLTF